MIEAYASATSVAPGENISFHVRVQPPAAFGFRVNVYRRGRNETRVMTSWGTAAPYATRANAYESGCGWPAAYTQRIPSSWSSGVYIARFTSLSFSTEVMFVVRAAAPGTNSKIVFQLAVTTDEAYNPAMGRSLYSNPPARKVSFNRPCYTYHFYEWELPFIIWLENNGFEVDYCTSIDLHARPSFLGNYHLLVSVGHDEYWSWEMRDNVESYVANGGNVAFFSGNVCWWQIRFEDNFRTMVCYKDAQLDQQDNPGIDPKRLTTLWVDPIIGRRENQMTGVSFENGAGWWNSDAGPRPALGFKIRFAQHWVFATTGLNDNDEFGAEDEIVGYETDATLFRENNGTPTVTGADQTPLNFVVLATADCTAWGNGGQAGMATMGIFRNNGTVFTAATTDWSHGLRGGWNAVSQITQNILRRLGCACQPSPEFVNRGFERWVDVPWTHIGHANNVSAMAAINGKLFAATKDNKLWWRDPVGQDVPWQHIGHADNVVAMTAANGKLFAVTKDKKLWRRDPVGQDVAWAEIGHANNVSAMAAINGKLFAATKDNKLWWRDPVGQDVPWQHIGHADNVVAMTAAKGKLFAATNDNKLWRRDPVGQDVAWAEIGHANRVVGLSSITGKLFAVTSDNELWWRDAIGRIPFGWLLEGAGIVEPDGANSRSGRYGLRVDATLGETWISQGPFICEGRNYYRVSCWAKANNATVTIRLQSVTTWADFAIASHSGSGRWEYLCSVGKIDNESPLFPARVKIQCGNGVVASFDNVAVEAL